VCVRACASARACMCVCVYVCVIEERETERESESVCVYSDALNVCVCERGRETKRESVWVGLATHSMCV